MLAAHVIPTGLFWLGQIKYLHPIKRIFPSIVKAQDFFLSSNIVLRAKLNKNRNNVREYFIKNDALA